MKGTLLKPPIPFTNIWYKDCFFMSLFHLLDLQQRNKILLNEFYLYQDSYELLNIKSVKLYHDIYSLLSTIGMTCNYEFRVSDVVESVIKSLDSGEYVILAIDPFYEDIRRDTYQKSHIPHCILVYGYSDKEFNIVEQNYSLSLQYSHKTITHDILYDSYHGFLKQMVDPNYIGDKFPSECKIQEQYPTYFAIKYNRQKVNVDIDKMISFILSYIPDMLNSIEHLESRKIELQKYYEISNETELNLLIISINKIIIAKKIDLYRFDIIASDKEKGLLIQSITKWTYLRTIFSKLLYTKKHREDHYVGINTSIDEILQCEYKYYKNLLNTEWRKIYHEKQQLSD